MFHCELCGHPHSQQWNILENEMKIKHLGERQLNCHLFSYSSFAGKILCGQETSFGDNCNLINCKIYIS